MNMRWVMTFKDAGQLKARLVVQGFMDPRLGKIPTSSPTASRRSLQIFVTLAASHGFQTHKEDVKCAFLQGDLDEQRVDDNNNNFKIDSAPTSFRHVLRTIPRVISKVTTGASSVSSTIVSMLQEDGTTVLRLIFET